MKFIGLDAHGTNGSDPSKMSAIYEIGIYRVLIPADTHPEDIELAIIDALELSDNPAAARELLESDDDRTVLSTLLDEVIPFLEGRGFNPSQTLNGLLNRRQQIRQKYPDGQPVPKPRKKDK